METALSLKMARRPLKILHLISSRRLYGAEKVVIQLSQGMICAGQKVVLGIMDDFNEENEFEITATSQAIDVRRIRTCRQIDYSALKTIKKIVKEEKIDIIHSHNYKSNFYAMLSRKPDVKWIATAHCWGGTDWKSAFYDFIDCLFIRFADAIVGVSLNLIEEFKAWKFPQQRCFYIPNGIDYSHLYGRKKIDDIFTIAFVGRMEREKNFRYVIEALIGYFKMCEYADSSRILLLGNGSLRKWGQKQIKRAGLENKIIFKGKVPAEQMPACYREIDCLFLPSLKEGLPMVVLEAMGYGIPIVGTRTAVIDLGQQSFVFLVDQQHVSSAIRQLCQLSKIYFEKTQDYLALSRDAQKKAESFNCNLMVERYLELYYNMLNYD